MVGKKRLFLAAGTLASVGAVIALAVGVTFGLFSATSVSGSNAFSAGTVTLSDPVKVTCAVTQVQPGDATANWISVNTSGALADPANATEQQCKFTVTYGTSGGASSDVPANLGLDLQLTGSSATAVDGYGGPGVVTASTPAPGLFDGTADGLQLLIQDDLGAGTTFVNGVTYTDGTGNPVTMAYDSTVSDLLVGQSVTPGTTMTFTVDYYLPDSGLTSNNYQGAGSTITLTVHAVQADNNASVGTVGQQDNSINWS